MRAALLVALVLLPLAAADHVYSHRVIVQGRVVDGEGLPVRGVLVRVEAQGESLRAPCGEGTHPMTDDFGDFWICYHKHEVVDEAMLTVVAGNASQSLPLDSALRSHGVLLRDESAEGAEPAEWATSVRVMGRVWTPGPNTLDGVRVLGLALGGEPVRVTFAGVAVEVVTDDYGDYDAWLVVPAGTDPAASRASVEVRGGAIEAPIDAAFRLAFVDARLPIGVSQPGSATPAPSIPLAVLFVAASLGMWAVQRRRDRERP